MKAPQQKESRKPTKQKGIPVETRKTGSGSSFRFWFSGLLRPPAAFLAASGFSIAAHPAPLPQPLAEQGSSSS
jgi:hypothetical protein